MSESSGKRKQKSSGKWKQKLVRIELQPNRLSATHMGDYFIPVYEDIRVVDGMHTLVEVRGAPVYLHDPASGLSAEAHVAAQFLFDAYRRAMPYLKSFVCERDDATYYSE